MIKFHEIISRSLFKALTFRAVIIVADSVVIFALTRRYDITLSIVIISNISSTFLYFIHERVWNRIRWGKTPSVSKLYF